MKREIKFRGKRVDNNEWVIGNLLDNGITKFFILSENAYNFDEYETVISQSIGQFTGFKDKNGVNIYEGDIIEKHFTKFEIIWNEGAWQLTQINDWYKQQFYIAHLFDYEKALVVGNIYENPELLKP